MFFEAISLKVIILDDQCPSIQTHPAGIDLFRVDQSRHFSNIYNKSHRDIKNGWDEIED